MLSLAARHLGHRWAAAGPAAALAAAKGFSAAAAAAEPFGEQLLADEQAPPFGWVQHNQRPSKPRKTGLRELLEAVGHAVDGLKFAGGSFSVHSRSSLRQLIEIAHEHGVYVSTGGWIEHVLRECKQLGFDYVELSTGFISLPTEDLVRLVRDVKAAGLQPKPELPLRYIKTLGASANLFVDHSQVVQLECLRRGIWGTKSTWGRVLTYQSDAA